MSGCSFKDINGQTYFNQLFHVEHSNTKIEMESGIMLTGKTIKISIKALEFLEKRVVETVKHNQEQVDMYLKLLENREGIITLAGGFMVKEEFSNDHMVRLLRMHKEVVLKNQPKLDEYREALKELKSL